MRRLLSACLVFVLSLSTSTWSSAGSAFAQSTGQKSHGWSNLKFAIFFTSYDVEHLLADPEQFKKTMDYFAPVKPVKVYLDGLGRDGKENVPLLKKLKEKFNAMGIEADGAMVPVSSRGGPSTYNNQADLESLSERMRGLARVFNRIILDDWLFTTATDPKSVADRGNETWGEYRTRLLLEQSKKYVIDPAKEVNPNAQVIIKFPNWYEGFAENGYDVDDEVHQFDKMAIGIETRVPQIQHQHIPIYSGYVLQRWESGVDPSKWVGSWLDNYGMENQSSYYDAQVWQAVFAGTPEIILWAAGQLWQTNPSSNVYPDFVSKLPEFERVAGLLKGDPRGVPMYLPYGSTGEYNIFGYLGMAGIPIDPVAAFPTKEKIAIFCLNSAQDSGLASEMLSRLREGKDIFMTFGLWKKLAREGTEFKNVLSLLPYNGQVSSSSFGLLQGYREKMVKAQRDFTFPGIQATTWPETRDVTLSREDYDFSVLMKVPYLNGTIYMLNMPSNSTDLLELPPEVLDAIRLPFTEGIGVQVVGAGHIPLYLFGDKQFVLYNESSSRAPVALRFYKKIEETGWRELVRNEQLRVSEDSTFVRFGGPVISDVSLTLQPSTAAVIQSP